MDFLRPDSLAEALAVKAQRPGAVPIAGGTDIMVEINFDAKRPEALLDLNRVPELDGWEAGGEPTAQVQTAAAEMGQGLVTVLGQITRTEFGIEQVVILPADTSVGSAGSSSARLPAWT